MTGYSKVKNTKFVTPIGTPTQVDGGRVLIERLIHLFKLRNRIELADLIGVTAGTLSTWTTRQTVPHELLIRLHLATGVSMEFLCFGEGDQNQDVFAKSYGSTVPVYKDGEAYIPAEVAEKEAMFKLPELEAFSIENGQLVAEAKYVISDNLAAVIGIDVIAADKAIHDDSNIVFINSKETTPTYGRYLFSIADIYQLGELRMLPDGHVYLFHDGEKYPINPATTKIHGKVVSVLESM
ncbi:hypothetical protein GCM10007978_20100 [Shewanella hanedai]|uniref:Bacteriophage CI repressor n=1 Tax=Shewanella hanedai TaxID=25 RepID=A0A553JM33_SHEHA|nr:helix-turn-helix transcriptional regulator [Shewanella hanedai]TRY13539.1 bacteriophage CI repressor [Shewanella hanedai]GGI82287.1 hypothetical protein GCM10007978_20100 [Shewanella hanedai]